MAAPNRIFIGGLDLDIDEYQLENTFKAFGDIGQVLLMRDRETQKSRGYAFISFREVESAQDAIERMNGIELNGRSISVREAEQRSSDRGRPFHGRGGRGGFRGRGRSRDFSSHGGYDRERDDGVGYESRSSYRGGRYNGGVGRGFNSHRDSYTSRGGSQSGYQRQNSGNSRYNNSDNFQTNNNFSRSGNSRRSRSPIREYRNREQSPNVNRLSARDRQNDYSPPNRHNDYSPPQNRRNDYSPPTRSRQSNQYSKPQERQSRPYSRDDHSPIPGHGKRTRYSGSGRGGSPSYDRSEYRTSAQSMNDFSPPRNYRNKSPDPSRRLRKLSPPMGRPRSISPVNDSSPRRHLRNTSPPRMVRNISPPARMSRNITPSSRMARNASPLERMSRNNSPPPRMSRNISPPSRMSRNISPPRRMSRNGSPPSRISRNASPSRMSRNISPSARISRNISPPSRMSRNVSPPHRGSRAFSPVAKLSPPRRRQPVSHSRSPEYVTVTETGPPRHTERHSGDYSDRNRDRPRNLQYAGNNVKPREYVRSDGLGNGRSSFPRGGGGRGGKGAGVTRYARNPSGPAREQRY